MRETPMENLVQDIRFALRMLRKNLGFATVAVLVLAVGIGATTAIFSVINAVLLQPLPYPDSDRLVVVEGLAGARHIPLSYPELLAWRDQKDIFEDAAAFINSGFALTGSGEPEQLRGMTVSASILKILGVKPEAGRNFLPEEDARTAEPVAMITHSFLEVSFPFQPLRHWTEAHTQRQGIHHRRRASRGFYARFQGATAVSSQIGHNGCSFRTEFSWNHSQASSRHNAGGSEKRDDGGASVAAKKRCKFSARNRYSLQRISGGQFKTAFIHTPRRRHLCGAHSVRQHGKSTACTCCRSQQGNRCAYLAGGQPSSIASSTAYGKPVNSHDRWRTRMLACLGGNGLANDATGRPSAARNGGPHGRDGVALYRGAGVRHRHCLRSGAGTPDHESQSAGST